MRDSPAGGGRGAWRVTEVGQSVLRSSPGGHRRRPADDVVAEHRPPAGHEVVLVRVIQGPPAVPFVHRPVAGGLVLPEPGPPALPVLPVPPGPLAVDRGRAGRLGDIIQDGITAAPSAAAVFGEPVLGQDPQRG